MRPFDAVIGKVLYAGALVCAMTAHSSIANSQSLAPSAPASEPAGSTAPTRPSRDTGDSSNEIESGVYNRATRGTAPIRFELRGAGTQSIGVSAENEDASYATFTDGCETPCTLWFERGRHFVRLGHSALRTRIFDLNVDARPATLRFSRDGAWGVAAGVAIGVAGAIATILGVVVALYTHPQDAAAGYPFDRSSTPWWIVGGTGLALFATGATATYVSFGSSEIEYPDGHDSRRIGPPIGTSATDR